MKALLERLKAPSSRAPARTIALDGMVAKSGTREAWWLLKRSTKLLVKRPDPAPQKAGLYISFSPEEDLSVRANKPTSALIRDIATDTGEAVFALKMNDGGLGKSAESELVNNLRAPWLYATYKSRIESLPRGVRLISGIAAMRGLLARNRAVEQMQAPFVAGLLFEGKEDVNVLILMVCNEDGSITNVDYIPLGDVEPIQAIRTFVQTVRLSPNGDWTQERTAIFSSKDLGLLALRAYPSEEEYAGIGVSKLWKASSVVSGAAFGACLVAMGLTYYQNTSIKAESIRIASEVNAIKEEVRGYMSTQGLGHILEKRSVNVSDAIEKAREVWLEGSTVTVRAVADSLRLIVTADIKDSPAALDAIQAKAPANCSKLEASATTQLTQLVLNYECQIPDSDLQRIAAALR